MSGRITWRVVYYIDLDGEKECIGWNTFNTDVLLDAPRALAAFADHIAGGHPDATLHARFDNGPWMPPHPELDDEEASA